MDKIHLIFNILENIMYEELKCIINVLQSFIKIIRG